MRIVVCGAGAVGGLIAAKLAAAGANVTLVARSKREAIERDGIRVTGWEVLAARPRVLRSLREAGGADLVVSCVKAYALPDIAPDAAVALAPGGTFLTIANGLPWWYGEGAPGNLAGIRLDRLDAHGTIRRAIPTGAALGCVAYLRAECPEPGVVKTYGGRGLVLGEPAASPGARLARTVEVFEAAGIATKATDDIRSAVWNKLFGNVSLNPLTAITGFTVDRLLADPGHVRRLAAVVAEAQAVAAAAGCRSEHTVAERIAVMAELGEFRTSMLQDADAGRPLEIDAITGAVAELGVHLGVPTPETERLYADALEFARGRRPIGEG